MSIINVSPDFTIKIPEMLLSKVGAKPGQEMMITERDGAIVIIPLPPDPIAFLCGILLGGATLTKELVAEREREIDLE